MKWKEKALNNIPAGEKLFEEGEQAVHIGILIKGRIEQINKGSKRNIGMGTFVGLPDVVGGGCRSDYRVAEDASVFIFPVADQGELQKVMSVNRDYPGVMAASVFREVAFYYGLRQELAGKCGQGVMRAREQQEQMKALASRYGYTLPEFVMPAALHFGIPQNGVFKGTGNEQAEVAYAGGSHNVLQECLEAAVAPVDALKNFYAACNSFAYREVMEGSALVNGLQEDCEKAAGQMRKLVALYAGTQGEGFLPEMAKLAAAVAAAGGNAQELDSLYGSMESCARELVGYLEEKAGSGAGLRETVLGELQERFGAKESAVGESASESVETILAQLDRSMDKLMEYGGMAADKAELFGNCVKVFTSLKDKFSSEDTVRRLRRNLSDLFYELYEAVFLRAHKEGAKSRLVEMFLDYGYLSEGLLDRNQLIQLYHRKEEPVGGQGEIPVYTASEWLGAVYEMRKDPSKNEFDMDFYEDLRERKKSEHMTAEQERAYLENKEVRLRFEVKNMFRYNCRTVSGQISTFVPFLFKEQLPSDLSRLCLTKGMIKDALRSVTEVDFSAFYREMLYVNQEKGIEKEYVQREVYPDIVLLPVFGNRGSMWQEITGRKRDTAGRFLFPAFTDGSGRDMMIPVIGRFRWELCRTIQGPSWNDIKVRSLTSEYSDYIQFYRKNKDLTEERKEKIKMQIQRARNSTKEIFVMDYETWIRHESQGSMRLNKVAREILATYCPLNKGLREKLCRQTMYEDAMARFVREAARKLREFEIRMRHIELNKGEITPELQETLHYYKDL